MAIKYTRRIPREADIHNANIQRYEAAKALADTYNQAAGVQPDAQANAPMSDYDRERERIRKRFTAPTNDDSNAWVRSANRGQAAIDNGRQLKPTPKAGSYEFATRNLPSGTPNAPVNYETIGDTINPTGIQAMRDAGGYTEEQLANPGKILMNWGMYKWLDSIGGLDHVQAQYEAYMREKRRQQMAYEAAMRQGYNPPASQSYEAPAESAGSGDSGSSEGFDMTGPSVADYFAMDNAYAQPSAADYYQLDAQTYKDADPYAYHDAHDPLIRAYNALREYNQNQR